MRDTHRQQNIESLSSSWITQLCAHTAPGGWGASEPRSGSWQRRNKKWQEGRVLPKEKVVVLIIWPIFFLWVFSTKDLKAVNKKELSKHKGGLGGWWCCRSREEGRPHPLLQVTIGGWWCLRFSWNFVLQSQIEVSLSDLVQVLHECTQKNCNLRHPDAQFRRSCEEIAPGVSISWPSCSTTAELLKSSSSANANWPTTHGESCPASQRSSPRGTVVATSTPKYNHDDH